MRDTPTARSSAAAAAGLVGGYLVARVTGRRELGGALFAAAGAWCARDWYRASGPTAAAGLSALYLAAMGGSHPLAKRIGAWPAVAAVTAATVATAELVTRISPTDRRP
jgi:thiol:disulfide interchange protein